MARAEVVYVRAADNATMREQPYGLGIRLTSLGVPAKRLLVAHLSEPENRFST
jgi:hypothetical protein